MTDQAHNAANPKSVKNQTNRAKLAREQYLNDLKGILATKAGVRVFSSILAQGRIFSTSFTGSSTTFFNEGARNMALKVFDDICHAAPERVQLIIFTTKEKENG